MALGMQLLRVDAAAGVRVAATATSTLALGPAP